MKTINIITIAVFVLLILTACSGINTKSKSTDLSEIVDITDTLIAKPKPEEAISLFNLNNDKWDGADFKLQYITNVSYNPSFEAQLEPENKWLGNQFKRAEKVKKFYSEINKINLNTDTETIGKDNSAVYFPIAMELNRLSKSNATTRILLIYSDLMENTNTITFYDSDTFEKIRTKPDSIQQYFESQLKLANLNGIRIYLIYQPINTMQDEAYKVVSAFYSKLFESKGASVEIRANLN